jgi:hypothetical protein
MIAEARAEPEPEPEDDNTEDGVDADNEPPVEEGTYSFAG